MPTVPAEIVQPKSNGDRQDKNHSTYNETSIYRGRLSLRKLTLDEALQLLQDLY